MQDFIDHTESITGDLDKPIEDVLELKSVKVKQQTLETDLPKRSVTALAEKIPFRVIDQNISRP